MWRAVERLEALSGEEREALLETHKSGQSPWLVSAKFKLVDGCNLKCFMCDYWKNGREGELETSEVLAALDDLAAMGCQKVHFTGGELFLRRDVLDLLEHTAALGMRVNLTTNGTVLSRDSLKALLKIPARSITLSIDSPVDYIHDRIRGQTHAYKRTVRTLDRILRWRGRKTRVRLNTVVHARNYLTLLQMPEFLRERPVDGWLLIPMDLEGTAEEAEMSEADIRRYNAEIAPALERLIDVPGFDPWIFGRTSRDIMLSAQHLHARGHYEDHRCWAPWFHTLIDSRGAVYPCCMGHRVLTPLGNIRDKPLREVFADDAYQRFRQTMLTQRPPVCHRCDDFLKDNQAIDALMSKDPS